MSAAATQALPQPSPLRRWGGRLLGLVLVSTAMWFLTRPSDVMDDPTAPPAGFVAGLKHGAKMPLALPRLLLGHDTTIYAESNTGRTYKLGYTTGVNACGALFFGVTFWRLNRLRKHLRSRAGAAQ